MKFFHVFVSRRNTNCSVLRLKHWQNLNYLKMFSKKLDILISSGWPNYLVQSSIRSHGFFGPPNTGYPGSGYQGWHP